MLKDFYSEVWTQDYPSHYPCLPTQNLHLCESNPHICIKLHLVQVHSVLPLFIFTFGRDVSCIKSICEHRNEIHKIKTFYLAFIAIVLLVTVQATEINLRWNESELNKTRSFFFFCSLAFLLDAVTSTEREKKSNFWISHHDTSTLLYQTCHFWLALFQIPNQTKMHFHCLNEPKRLPTCLTPAHCCTGHYISNGTFLALTSHYRHYSKMSA